MTNMPCTDFIDGTRTPCPEPAVSYYPHAIAFCGRPSRLDMTFCHRHRVRGDHPIDPTLTESLDASRQAYELVDQFNRRIVDRAPTIDLHDLTTYIAQIEQARTYATYACSLQAKARKAWNAWADLRGVSVKSPLTPDETTGALRDLVYYGCFDNPASSVAFRAEYADIFPSTRGIRDGLRLVERSR